MDSLSKSLWLSLICCSTFYMYGVIIGDRVAAVNKIWSALVGLKKFTQDRYTILAGTGEEITGERSMERGRLWKLEWGDRPAGGEGHPWNTGIGYSKHEGPDLSTRLQSKSQRKTVASAEWLGRTVSRELWGSQSSAGVRWAKRSSYFCFWGKVLLGSPGWHGAQLCGPGWLWTKNSACLYLLGTGIKQTRAPFYLHHKFWDEVN